jgi:hypothetical protein
VAEELYVVSSDEPASFIETEHNPRWWKAMMEEMDSIEENGTWSLVDLAPGCKLIGVKWVFKVKRNEYGVVSKHKARLGWTQCDYSLLSRHTRGGRYTT